MGDDRTRDADDDDGTAPPPFRGGRRWTHVDAVGAALLVVGLLGALTWGWIVVRSQFDVGGGSPLLFGSDEGSVVDRIDILASHVSVLLLAVLVVGAGAALRWLVRTDGDGEPTTPGLLIERPFGRLLLGTTASLVVLLVGATVLDDDEAGDGFEFGRAQEELDVEREVEDRIAEELDTAGGIEIPTTTAATPREPTHTLDVHTDGCGVFRSGEIGDDLTWVVKDPDGFQVLGRNAAGETQYRFFRPGTYTVVLESWTGDYYAEVSNVVTITC